MKGGERDGEREEATEVGGAFKREMVCVRQP